MVQATEWRERALGLWGGLRVFLEGRFTAPATWMLVFCCLVAYGTLTLLGGVDYFLGLGSRREMLSYYENHGLVPNRLGFDAWLPWLGMLTGMFLHVGPFHLAVNLVCLRCFGRLCEAIAGWRMYLGVYVFCGLMAGLCHVLVYPASGLAVVGASGGVSGLLGFGLLLRGVDWGSASRFGVWRYRVPAGWLVGLWLGQQCLYVLLALAGRVDLSGTALALHLGGLVSGLFAAWVLRWAGLVR